MELNSEHRPPLVVNGKHYPLWTQFVEQADKWIGGALHDSGDSIDRVLRANPSMATRITGIELKPNGEESAFFEVQGEDFNCGGDVQYLGVTRGEEGWITFAGYGGHRWRIKMPDHQS